MRPIKFRGRVLENHFADAGKMVFGYFVRGGNKKPYILVDNPNNNGQSLYQVDEDSVAQLVGYDKAGNEVYEGDKILVDNAGEDEFFATCLPVGVNHWGGCFLHGGNFIFNKEFSLKEACQNPWNALQEIDTLTEKHFKEAAQR